MKKVLLQSIAIAAILLTSCSKEVYYGSGDIVSETREMPQVDRLKISGVFEVNIEYGAIQKIEPLIDPLNNDPL